MKFVCSVGLASGSGNAVGGSLAVGLRPVRKALGFRPPSRLRRVRSLASGKRCCCPPPPVSSLSFVGLPVLLSRFGCRGLGFPASRHPCRLSAGSPYSFPAALASRFSTSSFFSRGDIVRWDSLTWLGCCDGSSRDFYSSFVRNVKRSLQIGSQGSAKFSLSQTLSLSCHSKIRKGQSYRERENISNNLANFPIHPVGLKSTALLENFPIFLCLASVWSLNFSKPR